MKKEELVNTYNATCAMQNIKGAVFEFRRFINKFKRYLKKFGEETLDDLEDWGEEQKNIILEHAQKDNEGKVIYDNDKRNPIGLLPGQNPEFDEASKAHKKIKDEILDGEIEIGDFDTRIHKKHLPKNEEFTAAMQEFIEDYIDG